MPLILWLSVYGGFLALWLLSYLFAAHDHFVTVHDMQVIHGFPKGIPFDGHIAMKYLDVLPFPALMATWVALYGYQWKGWQIIALVAAGFVLSAAMHYTYIEGGKKFPEFVTYGGKMTPVFFEHVVFMGFGLGLVGLAYFCTANPSPLFIWVTTIYLIVHVTLGVHVIYKIWTPEWFPYRGIDMGTLVPVCASTVSLLLMEWNALR